MRVVITGGAGFLGSRLARSILERGQLTDASGARRDVKKLVLIDVVQPSVTDPRIESNTGDLADPALITARSRRKRIRCFTSLRW